MKKKDKKNRILLIGDSIRMHYTPLVQKALKGKIKIISFKQNGEDSNNVLKNLPKWLTKAKSDRLKIIHFNCGLHDIKRPFESDINQVPIEKYKENLTKIVEYLKKNTNAVLIWATTTPVIYERHHKNKSFDRFENDVNEYNTITLEIMKKNQIIINDLNQTLSKQNLNECIKEDGVHMTEKGNKILADQVIQYLEQNLPE